MLLHLPGDPTVCPTRLVPLQSPVANPGSCTCASGWKSRKWGTPDPLKATTENPDDVQMEAMQTKRHWGGHASLHRFSYPEGLHSRCFRCFTEVFLYTCDWLSVATAYHVALQPLSSPWNSEVGAEFPTLPSLNTTLGFLVTSAQSDANEQTVFLLASTILSSLRVLKIFKSHVPGACRGASVPGHHIATSTTSFNSVPRLSGDRF